MNETPSRAGDGCKPIEAISRAKYKLNICWSALLNLFFFLHKIAPWAMSTYSWAPKKPWLPVPVLLSSLKCSLLGEIRQCTPLIGLAMQCYDSRFQRLCMVEMLKILLWSSCSCLSYETCASYSLQALTHMSTERCRCLPRTHMHMYVTWCMELWP